MTKSLTRDYGIDIFRILCCIGVLIYHIFDDILYLQNNTADTIYFLAAYCVPGFFMLSGYLLAQKESITFEYSEKKIIGILSKLFGWIVFWSVIHFIVTGELTDLWLNFSHGAISSGTLPVSWFLFTYCMLMIIGYPAFQLMKKYKPVFICLCIIWVIALAFGVGNSTWRIKPQALWLHLYVGYFIWGMCLASLKKAADKKLKSIYQLVIALTVCVISIYIYIYTINTTESFVFPDGYYGKWYYTLWLTSFFWLTSLVKIKNEKLCMVVSRLSQNTVVVYLSHLPILVYITVRHPITSPISAAIYVVVIFICCELLAELLKRLPMLRKLI